MSRSLLDILGEAKVAKRRVSWSVEPNSSYAEDRKSWASEYGNISSEMANEGSILHPRWRVQYYEAMPFGGAAEEIFEVAKFKSAATALAAAKRYVESHGVPR